MHHRNLQRSEHEFRCFKREIKRTSERIMTIRKQFEAVPYINRNGIPISQLKPAIFPKEQYQTYMVDG